MPGSPASEDHFRVEAVTLPGGARAYTKPGVRGHPELPPGLLPLLPWVGRTTGELLDASGSAGMAAAVALHGARDPDGVPGGVSGGGVRVREPSAAALACARRTLPGHPDVAAGLPWDEAAGDGAIGGGAADALLLLPPSERGSARVEAELAAAARTLRPDGVAFLALHKDGGAKRYAARAGRWFHELEVLDRTKGWRVLAARGPRPDAFEGEPPFAPRPFEAAGLPLRALPGVYAAGKLDPGTAALLAHLPDAALAGRRVCDLGCGYGLLALHAARAGAAAVTALDDDLAAVRSTAANAEALGLEVRALHSDLDVALPPEARFETVLCNPPFHLGRGVRLALPRAFVACAERRLQPGGELFLVANAQLPYEALFGAWAALEVLPAGRFKVLRARR